VGLFEIGVRRIEDERLSIDERVPEQSFEARVPSFGETRRDVRAFALARIEIDVEVLGRHHAKVERVIAHFVASEILSFRRRRSEGDDKQRRRRPERLTASRKPIHELPHVEPRSIGAPCMPR
jgi:hypothetical protein